MRGRPTLVRMVRFLSEGIVRLGWSQTFSPHSREASEELMSWLSHSRESAIGIAELEAFLGRPTTSA
jgi:hypothetical protein